MDNAASMTPRSRGSRAVAVLYIIIYALIVLTPMLLAYLSAARTDENFLHELGKMFAMVAVPILLLQPVLAARLRPITHHYGFDMVMRFHKGMAVLAAVLLVSHPVLIDLSDGEWGLVYSLQMPWVIWLGRIALLLLLIQGVTSLFQKHLMGFESWRWLHQIAVLILLLGWVHSFFIGDDLEFPALRVLWVVAGAGAVGFYLYHKVFVPLVTRRHSWEVTDVRQETHNVWTLTLAPPAGIKHFPYWPGQFRFLALLRPGRPFDTEEHHFTISSSPTQTGSHTSTIKESGDFTRTIGETRPGDRARVQGAYGRFSHALYPEEKRLIFIAGGIGITPLMSMLRYMRDIKDDREVVLLYGNRTEADIVFRQELEQMVAGGFPRLTAVHVLSEAGEGWQGERGYVSRELIERYHQASAGEAFYVCGPPPMMDKLQIALRELNVPVDRIHMERFYL